MTLVKPYFVLLLLSPERKARMLDEEANKAAAYLEGSHAIITNYTKECYLLHKVTNMPR